MPRHLPVANRLLREPCPVDVSTLPRVPGGISCSSCGRTVVDVAALTFEQAVDFRRRARSGGERICGAYTVDRHDRVLLRAAPSSSAVIAVAVGVLLAACETNATHGEASAASSSPVAAAQRATDRVETAPPRSPPAPAATVDTPTPAASAAASRDNSEQAKPAPTEEPAPSAKPECTPGKASAGKRSRAFAVGSRRVDMLAGY